MAVQTNDFVFIGFNADGNDDFAIVLLRDIASGEQVHFTDNEWGGSSFNTGEGTMLWTTTSNLSAGTVVSFNNVSSGASVSTGTISGSMALAASNEALWAFTGSPNNPTAIVSMIANEADGVVLTNSGLTASAGAVIIDGDDDVLIYDGTRTGTEADLLAAISNTANWQTQGGGGDQSNDGTDPDLPFDTAAFTITAPVPVTNTTQATDHATIQDAVDAANDGDVIDVNEAAYTPEGTVEVLTDMIELIVNDPDGISVNVRSNVSEFTHSGDADMRLVARGAGQTLTSGDGDDLLDGLANNDTLNAGAGNDIIRARAGDDTIDAGDGDDVIRPGAGANAVDGGAGNDRLDFADLTEGVSVDLDAGTIQGLTTGERSSEVNVENISGSAFNDGLTGDAGSNYIAGEGGNDALQGLAGNDLLRGGVGTDYFTGGADHDYLISDLDGVIDWFIFYRDAGVGEGLDRIQNFENDVDRIQFVGLDFADLEIFDAMLPNGVMGVAVEYTAGATQADVEADPFLSTGVIFIDGLTAADLTMSDFAFA